MEYPAPAYKATQVKFTEKLLSNPHTILRQTSSQGMGGIDARGVQHAAGKQWGGSTVIKDPRLQAQKPLLDGGEGKSLNKNIVKTVANATNCAPKDRDEFAGLMPPTLDSTGGYVTGEDKSKH
jgi:hypothetical protein